MTELMELVNVVVGMSDDEECMFPHFPPDEQPANKWKNSSSTLGTNLATEWANGTELYLSHLEETTASTGDSGRKNVKVSYNPHHLLPGDATWPKTQLKKWINKADGKVRDDIGYDVNCYQNGLDLPSNNAMRGKWTGRDDFQNRYAFAAMDADGRTRQFHDAHKAYSDFAIKVLDKIAAKLDGEDREGSPGCGEEDCPANTKKKPLPTPIGVRPRIHDASRRFARYLYGSPRRWRKPIMTSRFSLMYKNRKLTQAQATAELSPDNF